MDIKSLMKTKQDILASNLNILISHPVTKGDHCEAAWIDFFRSFLPNKYAVDKGFVFDSKGQVSDQIDIIIYDALYSPLVFGTKTGEKFITAESVYAVFDSKPTINKATLEYTNHKIQTVSSLSRTSREIIVGGVLKPARALTPILGGILAVDAIQSSSVEQYVRQYERIDFGCAINAYTFFARRDPDRTCASFTVSNQEEAVISFFFLILDELYKLGTVPGIDIRNYADATLDVFKLERVSDTAGPTGRK